MKKKRFLLGITLLASATLLVACQSKPNSTTSVEKSSTKTSSSKTDDNALSEEKRKRSLTKFYEEFPADQAARYQGTIDERSEKAWNNDQPNIFAGQASLKSHDDYLENDELKRLEVKILAEFSMSGLAAFSPTSAKEPNIIKIIMDRQRPLD